VPAGEPAPFGGGAEIGGAHADWECSSYVTDRPRLSRAESRSIVVIGAHPGRSGCRTRSCASGVVPSRELRQWRWARSRRRAVRSEATTDRRPRVAVSCSAAQERVTATRFGPGIRPFMRLPKLGSDAERNVSSRYEGGNSTIEAFPTPNCSTVGENWRRPHPTRPLSHRTHSHSVAACTPTGPSRPTRAPPTKPRAGARGGRLGRRSVARLAKLCGAKSATVDPAA
jgi:hypothetical protein